ncbi:MAG: hypothetical protein HGB12_11980, partial [Bacteroidetes bacterium]|nr:hypothetical protein [Bacteroidota bacterium]
MKIKHCFLPILIFFLSFKAFSQQECTYETSNYVFQKQKTVNVAEIKTDWNVKILNLENPREENKAYSEFIKKTKEEVEKRFPRNKSKGNNINLNILESPDTPAVIKNFEGNFFENSVPNDNNLAISNDGKLISAINTNLYFFDTENDTLLKNISLTAFSDTLNLYAQQYDPKLLYDPSSDKFVVVYLAGSHDTTSNIIVGFSQTNDPLGLWNLYSLPGNPVEDTSWSDFPAIALTNDELFITVNLLKNNLSWQLAFKQSVIWQIDKNKGYNGEALQTKLWKNIKFDEQPMRNLNPIQGGNELKGPDIYFLNTRNFAIQNDSIFLLHISNSLTDTAATLTVNALISDKTYGMPPRAQQPNNQLLETNDARVLSGFIQNNKIQFVGNTVDTTSGYATFYHGIINNVSSSRTVKLTIFTDTMEYGYPNLSYTGKSSSDNSAIISMNYSSSRVYPGFSCFYYSRNSDYSRKVNLKQGDCYINALSGADRWGDYSGSQPKYNEPGKVWVAGTFGKLIPAGKLYNKRSGTWISELQKTEKDIVVIPKYFDINARPNPFTDVM